MKFIHTADWHLGRLFHRVHLTDDQAYVLGQIIDLAAKHEVDAVIVAGDVYDRSVPPGEAVKLLDDVLARLVIDYAIPVVMIAGNHDGPERLSFGSRLLAGRGLHIFGSVNGAENVIHFEDSWGPVDICAIPFIDVNASNGDDASSEPVDHARAYRELVERVASLRRPGARSILVAHAFVAGSTGSDSERPLSVGGSDRVPTDCFAGFDYVALGHMHRKQAIGGNGIHYSGSILKYSFDEEDQSKGVHLVEMDGEGVCTVEHIPLQPLREVRTVTGFLADILESAATDKARDDYIQVRLLDEGAILDLMGKLRSVYPNICHVDRPGLRLENPAQSERRDHRKMSDADLFDAFYREVRGKSLSDAHRSEYEGIVEKLRSKIAGDEE